MAYSKLSFGEVIKLDKENKFVITKEYKINFDSVGENGIFILLSKRNVKLGARINSDYQTASLFVKYFYGYNSSGKQSRQTKYLDGLKLILNPTVFEKKLNEEVIAKAEGFLQHESDKFISGVEREVIKNTNAKIQRERYKLLEWIEKYCNEYTKQDIRSIRRAYKCFKSFLEQDPDYSDRLCNIKFGELTSEVVIKFKDYLLATYTGEGPHTVYARFKKIIKSAVAEGVLTKNPCDGITIKIDNGQLKKDILSLDEIQSLINTHYDGENEEIRRAFIFCLFTGLRWCDVKDLTFANVDYSNGLLQFEQSKTKGHSSASHVAIPLNKEILEMVGKGDKQQQIFNLPSHTMCSKALRHWVARAGIDKHITWHCARHSFATNLLDKGGANIVTVASLLGHSGLQHTQKYVRAIDKAKRSAIDNLFKPLNRKEK